MPFHSEHLLSPLKESKCATTWNIRGNFRLRRGHGDIHKIFLLSHLLSVQLEVQVFHSQPCKGAQGHSNHEDPEGSGTSIMQRHCRRCVARRNMNHPFQTHSLLFTSTLELLRIVTVYTTSHSGSCSVIFTLLPLACVCMIRSISKSHILYLSSIFFFFGYVFCEFHRGNPSPLQISTMIVFQIRVSGARICGVYLQRTPQTGPWTSNFVNLPLSKNTFIRAATWIHGIIPLSTL